MHDASPAIAGLGERRDRDVARLAQRTGHSREIGAQLVEAQAAAGLEIQKNARRAVGRRCRAVEVGGKEIAVVRDGGAKRGRRNRAAQHRVAVIGAELRAGESLGVREHVVAREIGRIARGRPHPEFRVVIQRRAETVGIEIITAARIVACRDRDAL